ncbi:MAG: metal-dependent transcriptional regulator [Brevinematales bacterium]|nr:metal-dependent transcriptional regulator [Brevinematales bacterium]
MTGSLEDYIEAIYLLVEERGVARVKEIADKLHVSKPSVIQALRQLSAQGFVEQERYGYIHLTDQGEKTASEIFRRHHLLKDFLKILGVSSETAEKEACQMEHILSEETMRVIEKYVAQQKGGDHDRDAG